MSDVFGSRGPSVGAEPRAGTPEAHGHGRTHFVEFDNETGGMQITLPPHLAEHREELMTAIHEEFFLAMPGEATVTGISEFIESWLRARDADF